MSEFDFKLQGTNGKGMLLIHGLTGSPAEMKFVGKALNRMGFTCFAPTLAGHCKDEATLLATTYEDWSDSIRSAIREFAGEVDEIHLAGICVGGMLGLHAAHLEQHPKVKTVTIYSPLLNYDGWNTPFYYKWAKFAMGMFARTPFLKHINFGEAPPYGIKSDRVRNAIMSSGGDSIPGTLPSFPARALLQNFRLNNAMIRELPEVHIPTLLIHAREDDVGHPRNSIRIQKLHGGPCTIEWLDDSYHMIHVDQERHKTAKLTAAFAGVTPKTETQEAA